jgi:uncharacterized repeat protein (TIGR03803 family)
MINLKYITTLFLFFLINQKSIAQTEIWGMATTYGKFNGGAIFKTDSSGNNLAIRHNFFKYEGTNPSQTKLLQATDGKLYGLTHGDNGDGGGSILFQYDPVTDTFIKKIQFGRYPYNGTGTKPAGSLIQATDGMLYGMTEDGGTNATGVIFQYNPMTDVYTKKFEFSLDSTGRIPKGSLMQASDGKLYGLCMRGGAGINNVGVLFQYDINTNTYSVKYKFLSSNSANGGTPVGDLIEAADGKLYGMTTGGGLTDKGVLFQYDPTTEVFTKKIDFMGASNGQWPQGSLLAAADGKLYGMTTFGGANTYGVLFQYDPITSVFTKKMDFLGGTNSQWPYGSLMEAADGKLYGTVSVGGTTGKGVLFQYDYINNVYVKKIDFNGAQNGSEPRGTLVQASNGKLYGMTFKGGLVDNGVLFNYDITTNVLSKKIQFGAAPNGYRAMSSLLQASDGFLYGLTSRGGLYDKGVLFQFNPNTYSYVKKFDLDDTLLALACNNADGFLMQASDGNIYGTYNFTSTSPYTYIGRLFQYNPITSIYTKKFDFNDSLIGYFPTGPLVEHANGKLYGTTSGGGGTSTIFEFDPITNSLIKKLAFNGINGPPRGSLIKVTNGKLYGVTGSVGLTDYGTIYEYDPITNNQVTKINFNGTLNGSGPRNSLSLSANGTLIGRTYTGGINNFGVIFQYDYINNTIVKKYDFGGLNPGMNVSGDLLNTLNGKLYGLMPDYSPSLVEFEPSTGNLNTRISFYDFNPNSEEWLGFEKSIGSYSELQFNLTEVLVSPNIKLTLASNTYCSGSLLNVPYIVSGSYVPSNQFTVQLSDSLGGFVNPINIGSINTIKDSSINCIIPINTLPSNNYKIRVVSSGPLVIGNSYTIKINNTINLAVNSGTICRGNSFTITPSGANTYTFANGSNIVSPLFNQTYTVTGTNANGCIASGLCYVVVDTIVPTLTIVGSNSICIGSNTNLLGQGANSYTWSTGDLTSNLNIALTTDASYTLSGENACGINTETVSVIVDNTCADVWPGDANSDGTANNLDVLELGLHYTQTGTPRALVSNTWQSYFSNNWSGTITNGKNLNHSDCNGDGTINDDDTLAIYTNYGLTHAFKTTQANVVNPQLTIVPDQVSVVNGSWGTASIYLGSASNPINNINGVAFSVNFDNALIASDSVYIEYQPSFIDASQNLHFRKLDFVNGKMYTATTHTNNINASGYGKIATLHYKISSTANSNSTLSLSITSANQSNALGAIVPLTSGSAAVATSAVGIEEITNSNFVSINPNPTNGVLTVTSKQEFQKIEVMAITGQVLLSETPTSVSHTLHLEDFSNGIYFINIYQNNHIVKREKVVLNK